jgi:hypothetical protein
LEIFRYAALAMLTTSIRHIGGRQFVTGNPNLATIDVTIASWLAEATLLKIQLNQCLAPC